MPELTIAEMRVVAEVARAGSFSAAAEVLGYTQSAVSRQVAIAERAVDTGLFERHARGVVPTPAGEVLTKHALQVIDVVESAQQQIAGLRDRLAGRITVGAFPTAMVALVPQAIAALTRTHPALEVRLTEAGTPSQLTALRRGRIEVAVVATGSGLPSYDLEGLRQRDLPGRRESGVAVAVSHPLATRDALTPADLEDESWIIGPRSATNPEFGAWPTIATPRVAFTAGSWPARLGLVAAGLGIALVPGLAASAVPAGVRWIPVRDSEAAGLGRRCCAVTGDHPSDAATALVDALVDVAASNQ